MTTENDLATFTVRLQKKVVDKLDARCKVTGRKRNPELAILLEQALDLNVAREAKLLNQEAKEELSEVTLKG